MDPSADHVNLDSVLTVTDDNGQLIDTHVIQLVVTDQCGNSIVHDQEVLYPVIFETEICGGDVQEFPAANVRIAVSDVLHNGQSLINTTLGSTLTVDAMAVGDNWLLESILPTWWNCNGRTPSPWWTRVIRVKSVHARARLHHPQRLHARQQRHQRQLPHPRSRRPLPGRSSSSTTATARWSTARRLRATQSLSYLERQLRQRQPRTRRGVPVGASPGRRPQGQRRVELDALTAQTSERPVIS